jgi:PAS domain S-box-containing protein
LSTLVAILAVIVALLYVVIALVVVPHLAAAAAGDGRRSKAITAAAIGAATFLLGCSVTHLVIAQRELSAAHEHIEDWQALVGHVIPHILQIAGGVTFLVVARRRLTVFVVRKDDSARVAELEGRLTHVLDAGHLGVWEVDLATGHTWHSAQHDRILGHDTPPPEWSYDQMLDQVVPDHRDLVRTALDLTTARPFAEMDCQIETPDGHRRWITITASLAFDDTGQAIRIVGTVADTTERHERELQRATLEDQLHTWQRTEAVGRLASGVAHDFNNVLGVVHGWAELLERDDSLSPHARDQVAAIRRAADHGRTLTQQLRTVSRHQADPPQPVDVNEVVTTVAEMIERLIPTTIRVHRDLSTGLGLSICQTIVQRAGGTIRARSTPGEGTTFSVELPAVV